MSHGPHGRALAQPRLVGQQQSIFESHYKNHPEETYCVRRKDHLYHIRYYALPLPPLSLPPVTLG